MSEYCPYTYKGYPTALEYPWTFPMPSEKERDRRWKAIRRSMREHNFDCLIVGTSSGFMPTLHNQLCYISNYVPYANNGTYVVFPLKGESQLCMHNWLGPQFLHIAAQTSWINEIVGSLHPIKDVVSKVKELKLDNSKIGIVGYMMGIFPASDYDVLRESFPDAILEDATAMLGEAMNEVSRSSEEEHTLLKRACEILDLSYEAVAEALKPGVTECELWAAAEQAIVKNGGWYGHFMLATSGPSPTFLRAPASHNAMAPGDVIMYEINVVYGGVSPQSCYALSLGRPKKEVEKMFDFCEELYQFALVELEKNRKFIEIELDLADRIHGAGYEPMTPQMHVYNMSGFMPMDSLPQLGDYFTVHPNVCNKNYTAGAKLGDAVRITKNGKVERLQKTPAKLNNLCHS